MREISGWEDELNWPETVRLACVWISVISGLGHPGLEYSCYVNMHALWVCTYCDPNTHLGS